VCRRSTALRWWYSLQRLSQGDDIRLFITGQLCAVAYRLALAPRARALSASILVAGHPIHQAVGATAKRGRARFQTGKYPPCRGTVGHVTGQNLAERLMVNRLIRSSSRHRVGAMRTNGSAQPVPANRLDAWVG
jgi:hypothetical protein